MSEDDPVNDDTKAAAGAPLSDADSSTTAHYDPWLRAAALSGVVTLPLTLVGTTIADLVGPNNLGPGSPQDEILAMLVDSHGKQVVAATMFTVASAATMVFVGPLWARVRTGSEWLAVIAVSGGVGAAVMWLVIGAGWSITAAVAADYKDAEAARLLMVSGWEMGRLTVAPYLAMVAAVTVAGFRHHVFGPRFNAVGAGFTLLLVIGLFPGGPAGLMGILATGWVFIASLLLAFGRVPTPSQVHRR
jgi:hypothetical protein